MRLKKRIVYILIVIMVLQLTGCKKEERNSVAMGRYMEEEVNMPVNISSCIYSALGVNQDNQLELYTIDDHLTKYTREEEGTWKTETKEWFQELGIEGEIQQAVYTQDRKGNEFVGLYEYDSEENVGKTHLYCYTAAGVTKEISGEIGESEEYALPEQICILEDGRILIGYWSGAVLYDNNGKKLVTYEEGSGDSITVNENEFYILNDTADKVFVYDIETGEKVKSIDVYNRGYYNGNYWKIHMISGNNQKICLLNYDGIHTLSQGGTIWETIIDGSLNTLCMPSYNSYSFCQDANGNFYNLCCDEVGNYMIYKYAYDSEVPAVPSNELTIYSLYEVKTLVQAIVKFQKENQDVKVNYRVAISDNDPNIDTSDYIRALNTELLAGNGADIIVFNGLDINDYIEKGILEDIKDIIKKSNNGSEELYDNIANTYRRDDAILAVPISIKIPLIYGKKEAVEESNTLEELVNYAVKEEGQRLFGDITYRELVQILYERYYDEFVNEAGEFQKDELIEFFNNVKILAQKTNCVKDYDEDTCGGEMGVLHGVAQLGMRNYGTIEDFACAMQVVDDIDGAWTVYNNQYKPDLTVGINKAGKQKEMAEKFLQVLMSDKISMLYNDEGISFNKKSALKNLEPTQEGIIITYGYSYNGEFSLYNVKTPTEDNLKKYADMIEKLDTPIFINETIEKKLLEVADEFYSSHITANEAAEELVSFTKIYNEE